MPPIIQNTNKTTDIVWARVDAVVNVILENDRYLESKRNKDLTVIVMKKFRIAERTAQRYISEAKKEIKRLGEENKKESYGKAIRDREFLFYKAKNLKRYKLALDIIRDRDKLCGLYIDEITINDKTNTKPNLSNLTEQELKDLAQLKR